MYTEYFAQESGPTRMQRHVVWSILPGKAFVSVGSRLVGFACIHSRVFLVTLVACLITRCTMLCGVHSSFDYER